VAVLWPNVSSAHDCINALIVRWRSSVPGHGPSAWKVFVLHSTLSWQHVGLLVSWRRWCVYRWFL